MSGRRGLTARAREAGRSRADPAGAAKPGNRGDDDQRRTGARRSRQPGDVAVFVCQDGQAQRIARLSIIDY